MSLDCPALLPELRAIARAAGDVILAHHPRNTPARAKQDASPVTDADEASERLILERLRALAPEIPVIAEEAVARGEAPPLAGEGLFFLIDPLDGTREYVAGRDEFAVNIGLVRDRQPILGVVLSPASGVLYAAAGPGTATVEHRGEPPRPIHVRKPPAQGLTVVTSRSHGDKPALAAYLSEFTVAEHRLMGSAIKFGLIAAGEADLYPRLGPTMEWDTAAGHAILVAAGGAMTTLAGGPFLYGKPGFRNEDFVARGG